MSYEIKLKNRIAQVEVLNRNEDHLVVTVDGREYALDMVQIGKGSYSILHKNRSFNLELVPIEGIKKYHVNTFGNTFEVEIIDAEAKYLANRNQDNQDLDDAVISSPIPGKVVQIPVNEGDTVEAGQTVVVISAMKMESEFKTPKSGKIAHIKVQEGQIVEARQELIVIEFDQDETPQQTPQE